MAVVYTEGVVKRGMSLKRFVEVTSENAARAFDLFPRKGAIAIGSDADLAVIDTTVNRKLTMRDFHLGEYSVWEGQDVRALNAATVLRGKVIMENGQLHGSPSDGQLLLRRAGTEAKSAVPAGAM
jgi:dihydropyrimidinase